MHVVNLIVYLRCCCCCWALCCVTVTSVVQLFLSWLLRRIKRIHFFQLHFRQSIRDSSIWVIAESTWQTAKFSFIEIMTLSSIFIAIFLVITLTLSKAYIPTPKISKSLSSSKKLIVSDSWRQKSVSPSSSFSRLFAAAPEAPKGRGPPPRKAPKDDVVQVFAKTVQHVCSLIVRIIIEC